MKHLSGLDYAGGTHLGKIEYFKDGVPTRSLASLLGEDIKIRVSVPRTLAARSVYARYYSESGEELAVTELAWCDLSLGLDRYECKAPEEVSFVGLYFFEVLIDTPFGTYYVRKSADGIDFTRNPSASSRFQISVSDFRHPAPSKYYGGIIYHVFVDRFRRGGRSVRAEGSLYPEDWDNIPEFPEYPGAPLKNNTFFGGTLDGIREKLPYISSLGVTLIYLSPIFKSVSNHKYDTGDYMTVDEGFGSDEALRDLISAAKKYGIGIILDGVFNHTGADSKYFNRYASYDSLGAYQSKDSPYYSWYDFQSHPNEYTSWWGIEILPRINPNLPECAEYFVGDGGVISKYADMGIVGMRLDVADELPDSFIEKIKSSLTEHGAELLYGEVWEDASNKVAYGKRKTYYLGSELDGVMNYPLRRGIIAYLLHGRTDELRYALTDVIDNAPRRIRNMQMNLLGTHDTERILTLLAGKSPLGQSNATLRTLRLSREERRLAERRLMAAYTVLATLPGIPAIFYGDEAGLEGYHDPFNRMPYPWGKENGDLVHHYTDVGQLRRANAVYREGDFSLIHLDGELLIFARYEGDNAYLTLLNRTDSPIEVSVTGGSLPLLPTHIKRVRDTYVIDALTACVIKADRELQISF
ncbi:MAG: glycoside hydrolase family 13 protein [Clostridia bacterium]|nr:glycoside hydrolase family 13 protein [Clostridia bacterium]